MYLFRAHQPQLAFLRLRCLCSKPAQATSSESSTAQSSDRPWRAQAHGAVEIEKWITSWDFDGFGDQFNGWDQF